MVAKIRWKWIRLPVRKDQRAESIEETARDKQGHGSRAELPVDGSYQENNDPAHQEEGGVRHPDGDLGEEDGFERDEEDRQTPDDPEQNPARSTTEDR